MCGHNAHISMHAKFTNLRSAAAARPLWRGLRALAPNSPASERAHQCGPDLRSPRTRTSSLCREGVGFGTAMHHRHGCIHRLPAHLSLLAVCPALCFMLPTEGFVMRVITPRGCEWAWVVAVGWAWERAGARRKGRWRTACDGGVRRVGAQRRGWWQEARNADIV
ncbi:hypothetical protein C8J57DRAFT_1311805 [Mycena rebaudengoi]|nr:hypothetical protein C8J57DRAFT_1311805 [Mycena rebaudengoi]